MRCLQALWAGSPFSHRVVLCHSHEESEYLWTGADDGSIVRCVAKMYMCNMNPTFDCAYMFAMRDASYVNVRRQGLLTSVDTFVIAPAVNTPKSFYSAHMQTSII
jgi:hypothetical protein